MLKLRYWTLPIIDLYTVFNIWLDGMHLGAFWMMWEVGISLCRFRAASHFPSNAWHNDVCTCFLSKFLSTHANGIGSPHLPLLFWYMSYSYLLSPNAAHHFGLSVFVNMTTCLLFTANVGSGVSGKIGKWQQITCGRRTRQVVELYISPQCTQGREVRTADVQVMQYS